MIDSEYLSGKVISIERGEREDFLNSSTDLLPPQTILKSHIDDR